MSNGKGCDDDDFTPIDDHKVQLSGSKIRHKRVLKVLKKLDSFKSANGISPRFLKECALEIAPALTKLFKLIVRKGKFPSRWKHGRITPLHKRDSLFEYSNYRPLQVLENMSIACEDIVDPQLTKWLLNFTPSSQFCFITGCGTIDYGKMLSLRIQCVLEARGEGIMVSLDVKGAFDRCWWGRLKKRFEEKGMCESALGLIKDYLWRRFIRVVNQSISSAENEIFSNVPHGGKWSPKFWNFDISEIESALCELACLFCYADDSELWYEVTHQNRNTIIDTINKDLKNSWHGESTTRPLSSQRSTLTCLSLKGKLVSIALV